MARINLFYLSPNTTGGWVTFTAHLVRALEAAGHTPQLKKIGTRTENKSRPFGYGCYYTNTSLADALRSAESKPTLIVAAAKNFREATESLLARNAFLVLHDPTEFNNFDSDKIRPERCVVVRKAGLTHVPGATFIRHPYRRRWSDTMDSYPPKNVRAVATSRIDFDKNTNLLLDANRLLQGAESETIKIYGFENRLYTKFKIVPKYPEWEQSKCAYPRDKGDEAYKILLDAAYLVDMSIIKNDGGGTQYTTLEAWDAGAVPLIHTDWIRPDDDMVAGKNCATAKDGAEIAAFLTGAWTEKKRLEVQEAGYWQLQQHSPKLIGDQYAAFMGLE